MSASTNALLMRLSYLRRYHLKVKLLPTTKRIIFLFCTEQRMWRKKNIIFEQKHYLQNPIALAGRCEGRKMGSRFANLKK